VAIHISSSLSRLHGFLTVTQLVSSPPNSDCYIETYAARAAAGRFFGGFASWAAFGTDKEDSAALGGEVLHELLASEHLERFLQGRYVNTVALPENVSFILGFSAWLVPEVERRFEQRTFIVMLATSSSLNGIHAPSQCPLRMIPWFLPVGAGREDAGLVTPPLPSPEGPFGQKKKEKKKGRPNAVLLQVWLELAEWKRLRAPFCP